MEEYLPGRTENLHDYLIPTVGDVPEIECILIEDREPLGPSGAKGVGEPGLMPTAPAILGAIHHATGVRVTSVPATAAPRCARPSLAPKEDSGHERRHRAQRGRTQRRASCAAMPARCCAASGPAAPAPATATPTRTASWCASIRWCCWPSPTWRASPSSRAATPGTASSVTGEGAFVTGIGAGTTYPDYKPAPFIVSSEARRRRHGHGRDRGHLQLLRRQGEDRHRPLPRPGAGGGARRRARRSATSPPAEYGSQMLSLGGVHHLTGGSKKEGVVTCDDAAGRCATARPVELAIDGGATRGRAGRQAADRQRRARGAHARRLRLGHHRHVRAAMARPCRRGDRGRRPHHRRADRAPGRPLPRHAARRHPRARPPIDAGPLFPGRRARAWAGAAPTSPIRWRSSRGSIPSRPGPACGC